MKPNTEIAIARTPVNSSQIESVGYHAPSKTMEIEFKGGSTYRYGNVEPHDHANLIGADSVGSHFHKHIKHNSAKHPYQKVS
jgi:hypothetical protein